ncbi:MAG TPA: hypothetical protein VGR26_13345, partial [Acidimicrobiales bacterium]|nr:hypothetical protein [Acidimicrobiales bacterium]
MRVLVALQVLGALAAVFFAVAYRHLLGRLLEPLAAGSPIRGAFVGVIVGFGGMALWFYCWPAPYDRAAPSDASRPARVRSATVDLLLVAGFVVGLASWLSMLPPKSFNRTATDDLFDEALPGASGGFVVAVLLLLVSVVVISGFAEALTLRRDGGWRGTGEVLWHFSSFMWAMTKLLLAWVLIVGLSLMALFVIGMVVYG